VRSAGDVDMTGEIETLCAFEDRVPTTGGERRAAVHLRRRMEDIGLETSVDEFKVNPHYYWVYLAHMLLALGVGVAAIWTSPRWIPWVAAGVIALVVTSFWGDLTTRFHLIRNTIPRYPSQNVMGKIPRPGAKKHIIVSAHYDAAKAGTIVFNPNLDEKVARFYKEKFNRTPNVMMPMIIAMLALVAVCVTRGIVPGGTGMWIPTGVVQGFKAITIIAVNENNIVPHYHTDEDAPENVDISVTMRARDLVLAMIRELDKE